MWKTSISQKSAKKQNTKKTILLACLILGFEIALSIFFYTQKVNPCYYCDETTYSLLNPFGEIIREYRHIFPGIAKSKVEHSPVIRLSSINDSPHPLFYITVDVLIITIAFYLYRFSRYLITKVKNRNQILFVSFVLSLISWTVFLWLMLTSNTPDLHYTGSIKAFHMRTISLFILLPLGTLFSFIQLFSTLRNWKSLNKEYRIILIIPFTLLVISFLYTLHLAMDSQSYPYYL